MKILVCTVAHKCHGKRNNLEAKEKDSRQKEEPHGRKKKTHGKRKNFTAKRKDSRKKKKPHGRERDLPCFTKHLHCIHCNRRSCVFLKRYMSRAYFAVDWKKKKKMSFTCDKLLTLMINVHEWRGFSSREINSGS